MPTYIVSYEVQDEATADGLNSLIKASGDAMLVLDKFWLVDTVKSAKQLRDEMKDLVSLGDRAVVIKAGAGAAWSNIRGENKWVIDHLSSS
ncbi:hypothetical protein [Pseudomonas syringae]|uniref:hypothetical protein n=1 Tax=Pseudomonas syringae TaxID=317 RepID=UPI0008E180CE|nr:hypothetical protein [Pseudomonas syringae]UZS67205.1 hypothetical protein OQB65_23160 [Pseudomonas syringae]SFI16618.1 hypothetical protein SAMN05444507_10660 [Pseudomonas syringae]